MNLFLIGLATSADIFAAALGIGAAGIKFPVRSAFFSALSGAAVLWLAAVLSAAADSLFPIDIAIYISKAILLLMGLHSLLGEKIKKLFIKDCDKRKKSFNYSDVMNDPKISDIDNSKSISVPEGVVMGAALSADSVFMGISAGISGISPVMIFLSSLIWGMAAILSGTALGSRLALHIKLPIGGIILIILAFII